jgi:hypothetical protein
VYFFRKAVGDEELLACVTAARAFFGGVIRAEPGVVDSKKDPATKGLDG